jgi:site-specific recombinase XerD
MSILRTKMTQDLIVRGLATTTQDASLHAVTELSASSHRRPAPLSTQELHDSLLYLSQERGLAWGTCNGRVHALRFFSRVTLGRTDVDLVLPRAKEPSTLPVMWSQHDIRRLLAGAPNLRARALRKTAYGTGLRVSEAIRLTTTHIDRHRMAIRVEHGKRHTDRSTLLSHDLLRDLRASWRQHRCIPWLCPTPQRTGPLSRVTAHRICHIAKARAGMTKPSAMHALRHVFAPHLLEAGTALHTIQRLFGHKSIQTTWRYFQLSRPPLLETRSPLDRLHDAPEPES